MTEPLYYQSQISVKRSCGHTTTVPCVGLTTLDLACSEINAKELMKDSTCGKCRVPGKDANLAGGGHG